MRPMSVLTWAPVECTAVLRCAVDMMNHFQPAYADYKRHVVVAIDLQDRRQVELQAAVGHACRFAVSAFSCPLLVSVRSYYALQWAADELAKPGDLFHVRGLAFGCCTRDSRAC